MEAANGALILGWLTLAMLAASFSGNNSSASPLEDGLAVPAERDACAKEFVPSQRGRRARQTD
jgi:hypothetical protein